MESPCPTCGEQVKHQGNPYRPFCSKRCKLIDLESWMSERYRVPVDEDSPDRDVSKADPERSSSNGTQ